MPLTNQPNSEAAFRKLKHYCAYQERSHKEVDQKLRSLGVWDERSSIIARLIEENFLNEERYAITYARGKFRILGWGKVRIRLALQQQEISEYCIRQGLKQIDQEDYLETLRRLAKKKWEALDTDPKMRRERVFESLLRKGYESALVHEILSGLEKGGGADE